MANLLDRFRKESVGSEDRISDYVQKIDPSGDFQRIYEINAILNSWNNILLTPKRSFPNDPEYGSDLYKLVFEPLDQEKSERIINETVSAIEENDNRAIIKDVNVKLMTNAKGFTIDIVVEYDGDTDVLSLALTEQVFSGLLTVGD